jgi:hypothetical protein
MMADELPRLPQFTYRYCRNELVGGALDPVVPLHFFTAGLEHAFGERCLVDSGADWSMFPMSWHERLGIGRGELIRAELPALGFYTSWNYEIWELHEGLPVTLDQGEPEQLEADPAFRLRGLFSPNLRAPVVGREDFLTCFDIWLDQPRHTLHVRPYPETLRGDYTQPMWWHRMVAAEAPSE